MSTRRLLFALVGLLVLMALPRAYAQGPTLNSSFGSGGSNIAFTQNLGQVADPEGKLRPEILYTTSFGGVDIFVAAGRISYVYHKFEGDWVAWKHCDFNPSGFEGKGPIPTEKLYRMDMELIGSNPSPKVLQSDKVPGFDNYYYAHCPDGILNVGSYQMIVLQDVYPNIDMVLRGSDRGMKCDFVVRPGGRPTDIRMRYLGGTTPARLIGHGELRVENPFGFIQEDAPYSFQPTLPMFNGAAYSPDGTENKISSKWIIGADGSIAFNVGRYDVTRPLVIDPTRKWATYYGGSGQETIFGSDATEVDRAGDVYITGLTGNNTFPVSIGPAFAGNTDMIVVKMKSDGTRLWATMIGGTGGELSHGIATDRARNVYIAGHASSNDFPVLNAQQSTYGGGGGFDNRDAIVAKFDTNGVRQWATYFGGYGLEDAYGFAIDSSDNPAVVGATGSSSGVSYGINYDPTYNGQYDAFLAKYNNTGVLQWATYFGGTSNDCGWAAATDKYDNITIAGWTNSANFPTLRAFQGSNNGNYDAFVVQFNRVGNLLWSTYYGGGGQDGVDPTYIPTGYLSLATDGAANIILGGRTSSTNFPLSNPTIQNVFGGGTYDAFIVNFDSSGARRWATYQGGNGEDRISGVASNNSNSVLVTGATGSTNFPGITFDAYQGTKQGGAGSFDAFVMKINAAGTARTYGTFYGGTGANDEGMGISFDPFGSIVFGGETNSTNLPVTAGAYQGTYGGSTDGFLALFCDIEPGVIDSSGPLTFCQWDSVKLTVTPGYKSYLWSTGATTNEILVRDPGNYYVDVTNGAGCTARSDTLKVLWYGKPNPAIAGPLSICAGDSTVLTVAPRPFAKYSWYDGTLTTLKQSGVGVLYRSLTTKIAGTYRVIVTDTTGCLDTSAAVTVVVNPKPAVIDITPLTPDTFRLCKGDPFVLSANRGIAGGETFTWTPSGSGQTVTPSASGTYQLKVSTAAGCTTLSRKVVVIIRDLPDPRILVNPSATICQGDSVQLDAFGPGSSTWKFKWSTGDTTSFIRAKIAGNYEVEVTDSNGCKKKNNIQITVEPRPTPTITPRPDPPVICKGDSVQLDAGFGYNDYIWSNGETTQRIWVKDSGDYSVQVHGGTANCLSDPSNIIRVRVNPRPSATFAGPLGICINATATYTATKTPNVKYKWVVSGAGGTIITGDSADNVTVKWGPSPATGTVRLTVTDTLTGCSKDTTLSITIGTALAPTVLPNMANLCPGDSVSLDAGPGYDSYEWVDKSGSIIGNSRSITVKDSGTYFVRIAKGTCAGQSGLIPVRWVQPPTPRITVTSGDTTICSGGIVVLDAGAYAKYQWTPAVTGSTGRSIVVNDSGTFQVRVTDNNGCVGLSQIVRVRVANPPAPIITGSAAVCVNSSTNYSVPDQPGSSYTWGVTAPGFATITAGQNTSTVTINWTTAGTGFVTLTQTSTVTNCTGVATPFQVDVGSTLTPTITTSTGSTTICDGDTTVLRAPSGFTTYKWTDGSGATLSSVDSLVVRAGGTYTIDVGSGACSGSGSVVIVQKPAIVPTITGMRPLCAGDTLVLQADAGYARYLWSNGDTTQTTRVATTGNYTVRCTDVDGCSGITPPLLITVNPLPIVRITAAGDILTSTAGSIYQWYLNGTPIVAGVTQVWQARTNGDYTVRVTDSNGCSAVSPALTVAAGASATITIRDYQAAPGDLVSIPLELSDGVNLDRNGITSYKATIRFNKTVLAPTTSYPTSYVGEDRILTINGTIPAGSLTNGPLTTLEFIAALGKVAQTPITIETFAFVEDTAITTTINGTFSLTGLCTTGGTRLVDGSGATALRPVRPNPVVHTAEVEYEIVEDGLTQLYLVDVLGRVTPVVHAPLTAGRYVATFDVSTLPSGMYICVLQTATQRMSAVMHVER